MAGRIGDIRKGDRVRSFMGLEGDVVKVSADGEWMIVFLSYPHLERTFWVMTAHWETMYRHIREA